MSDCQLNSNSSELSSGKQNDAYNYFDEGGYNKQLEKIVTKKGKLIQYPAFLYFIGIIVTIIFFLSR